PPKCSYTTGLVIPARSAISSTETASYPCCANSRRPTSTSCARRAEAARRGPRLEEGALLTFDFALRSRRVRNRRFKRVAPAAPPRKEVCFERRLYPAV